ncbi:type I-E CRISPR-associated protein Cas6/Cse3/CasE [Psychromicrobium xiongbiense]|uniref:type I-E CRISPR-associated protein Cas6/Cse3/CasE n=1 Tax=Psychromicrobium xiongbiense TaxID=3051184 RepID=UPI002552746B|nr:type I-E CRISPR-associated protein Cas6/Cse3/CasE [Psychromicrobium sp. YIM S02556]
MFLTRFQINPRRRGSYKLLSSPQAMHAAVLSGFAEPQAEGVGRVLWRVDSQAHQAFLYIVSGARPDLSHLVEQAGWPTTETWLTHSYDSFLDGLAEGQRWGFRLTANPTKSLAVPGGGRGKVIPLSASSEQLEWLLARAERSGFSIPLADGLDPEEPPTPGDYRFEIREDSVRKFLRQGQQVTLAVSTFDGVLDVVDAARLRRSLMDGIGRAKGYGCGLMTLAPLSRGPE